jgi:hypothetical protein
MSSTAPGSPDLVELYVEQRLSLAVIGLAAGHIVQLTRQPAERVLQLLREHGIPVRSSAALSPWLQRQRDNR